MWRAVSDDRTGLRASPTQSFSGPSPVGLATIFYCLRFETSLFITSYHSQGYGGGIRLHLHISHPRSSGGRRRLSTRGRLGEGLPNPVDRRLKSQSQIQSYFTTGDLPPISSSCRRATRDPRPDFFSLLNTCGHSPYTNITFSLTRGWVCHLKLLLALDSAFTVRSKFRRTRDHILLSQIWDFPFFRLLRLAGLRWKYSTRWPTTDLRTFFYISGRTEERAQPPTSRILLCFIRCHETFLNPVATLWILPAYPWPRELPYRTVAQQWTLSAFGRHVTIWTDLKRLLFQGTILAFAWRDLRNQNGYQVTKKTKKQILYMCSASSLSAACYFHCCCKGSANNTLLKHESGHWIAGPGFSWCQTSCRLKCFHGRHVDDDVSCLEWHTHSTERHTDQWND
jgi:hypothetical protein